MAVARSIVVGIIGDNKSLKNALNESKTQISGFSKFGKTALVAVSVAATAIGTALFGVGAASYKAATELNKNMANIATLIPGATERVIELKEGIQDVAIETAKSTQDIAQGTYQVISAFGDTADTLNTVNLAARSATAGMSTTEDAINLLSAVTKGYGDISLEAQQKVSDLAFETVKLGQTTFPELASSMGAVVPLAVELKIKQEELFAAMATGTGVTGSTAEVATQLKGAMQALLSPTEAGAALIRELGYANGAAMAEQLGLVESLKVFTERAKESNIPLSNFIGSIRGQIVALSLTGNQYDVFNTKQLAMQNAAGATDAAFNEVTNGINKTGYTAEQVKVKMEVMSQRIGDFIIPYVGKALDWLMPKLDQLMIWTEENIPKIEKLFEGLSFKIGLYTGQSQEDIEALNASIPNLAEDTADYTQDMSQSWGNLATTWENTQNTFNDFVTSIKDDGSGLNNAMHAVTDSIAAMLNTSLSLYSSVLTGIKKLFEGDFLGFAASFGNLGTIIAKAVGNIGLNILEIWMPDIRLNLQVGWMKVQQWFTTLPSQFAQFARDAINGFIGGILDSAYLIKNAVVNFVDSYVYKPIKNFLQIGSPSKLMRGIGKNSMSSMALGYEDVASDVQKRINALMEEHHKITQQQIDAAEKKRLESITDASEREIYLRERAIDRKKELIQESIEASEKELQTIRENATAIQQLQSEQDEQNNNLLNLNQKYNNDRLGIMQDYQDQVLKITQETQSQVAKIEEEYQKTLQQRTQELLGGGLFGGFRVGSGQSVPDITQNIGNQVDAILRYNKAIDELEKRGASDAIISEAKKAGVGGVANIEELVAASDEELRLITDLYNERNRLANEQATEELEGMRAISDQKIMAITETEQKLLEEANRVWSTSMTTLRSNYYESLEQMNADTETSMQKIISSMQNALPQIEAEAKKIGAAINWATKMLAGTARIAESMPDVQSNYVPAQGGSTNIYNVTSPAPMNERELARQLELTNRRFATELL